MADDDLLIERLLRVIDEGRRTATYKLALLLAVIEAVALSPGRSYLPTRLIAERVLALYHPMTRPYVDGAGAVHQARQISSNRSVVFGAVEDLRAAAEAAGCRHFGEIATALPDAYASALDTVEDTFVRFPIPLLQVIGTGVVPFLYEVDWPEGTRVRTLRLEGRDRVRLFDGVADRLAVLGPLLRPLIELHWTRDVARLSGLGIEDEALRTHLFGTARTAFPRGMVAELSELQGGACFYCGTTLGGRREVDHFLAWSRWPNDAVENLVVADRCNNHKRDHLAAGGHLARWRLRVDARADDLAAIAGRHRWPTAPDRTRALVHTTYNHVATGTPLWLRGSEFEIARGPMRL